MDLIKAVENLKKNNMNVHIANTKAEVAELVQALMPKGSSVTHGGSVTIGECGLIELLKSGDYIYYDRTAVPNPREVYLKGYGADFFLTSANAVTENGELYNVDGNANRVSAYCYGPKKLIVVVGQNKVVATLDDAVHRVKTIAAPLNAKRLNCKTYCAENGKCVSLLKDSPSMTDGCASEARICRNYLISGPQQTKGRITVIIVKENLGY